MAEIKIDGVSLTVDNNITILEAAEEAGIYIPTFCHYKMLAPFGACRVCIVEVKGSPKLFTACTTPVTDKMEIITKSPRLNSLRKTLIELLLIHHPLDCPVCDKGGECQLQDLTYEFGVAKVRFDEKPKNTPVDHSNPFIERDIDRCVLCGKCVRICDEVVNIQSISFINRGTSTYIGTAFDQPWHCEYCGQCLSVCPVGSLNNRVYLFKNRPWKLSSTYSICGFCSCGCTVRIDHEDNEVYRIKEDVDKGINHGFLCAKGRFGYELINSAERKEVAVITEDAERKKEVAINDAISLAFNKLNDLVKNGYSKALGFYISPRLTNEEAFLIQKLAREYFKTNNIYSSETVDAKPCGTFKDVEESDAIIVFNVDVTESNPILGLAVRRAARAGANLTVFYPSVTALKRVATEFITGAPSEIYSACENLLKYLNTKKGESYKLSEVLKNAKNPVLIYNPYNSYDLYYVKKLNEVMPSIKLLPARIKNNSQGIIDMGCTNGYGPGFKEVNKGLPFEAALLKGELKYLVVFGENLVENLSSIDFFNERKNLDLLIVFDPFESETAKLADIYIPVSLYAEKNGSYTNMEGRVQSINKAIDKNVLSDLDILLNFCKMANLTGFNSIKDIRAAVERENPLYKGINWDGDVIKYSEVLSGEYEKYTNTVEKNGHFILYPEASRLHSGTFTRWSIDLNKVYNEPVLNINPIDAESIKVSEGDRVVVKSKNIEGTFKVSINKHITRGLVTLPDNYRVTLPFFKNGPYCAVDISKY